MPVVTATGARIFVGQQVSDVIDSVEEFEVLSYTEIRYVENMGEYGDESGNVQFAALDQGRVLKLKAARDAGVMALTVGRDPTDAGQNAMLAAEGTKLRYAFKVELPDALPGGANTLSYFRALVLSRRNIVGANDSIIRRTFAVAIDSQIYEGVVVPGEEPPPPTIPEMALTLDGDTLTIDGDILLL